MIYGQEGRHGLLFSMVRVHGLGWREARRGCRIVEWGVKRDLLYHRSISMGIHKHGDGQDGSDQAG